jgi:hypothetical protein
MPRAAPVPLDRVNKGQDFLSNGAVSFEEMNAALRCRLESLRETFALHITAETPVPNEIHLAYREAENLTVTISLGSYVHIGKHLLAVSAAAVRAAETAAMKSTAGVKAAAAVKTVSRRDSTGARPIMNAMSIVSRKPVMAI